MSFAALTDSPDTAARKGKRADDSRRKEIYDYMASTDWKETRSKTVKLVSKSIMAPSCSRLVSNVLAIVIGANESIQFYLFVNRKKKKKKKKNDNNTDEDINY